MTTRSSIVIVRVSCSVVTHFLAVVLFSNLLRAPPRSTHGRYDKHEVISVALDYCSYSTLQKTAVHCSFKTNFISLLYAIASYRFIMA
jgi:hypothetical protein